MKKIILYILAFIVIMTIILSMIPIAKIIVIANFFNTVLPKIPFVGIIESFFTKK